jgi:hypothetical protein
MSTSATYLFGFRNKVGSDPVTTDQSAAWRTSGKSTPSNMQGANNMCLIASDEAQEVGRDHIAGIVNDKGRYHTQISSEEGRCGGLSVGMEEAGLALVGINLDSLFAN